MLFVKGISHFQIHGARIVCEKAQFVHAVSESQTDKDSGDSLKKRILVYLSYEMSISVSSCLNIVILVLVELVGGTGQNLCISALRTPHRCR